MAKDILRYFLRNPQAADTLEGVAKWRLLEEVIHQRVEQTQTALGWLAARGFLRAVSTQSTGRIFSLNPDNRAEAEQFLAVPELTPDRSDTPDE